MLEGSVHRNGCGFDPGSGRMPEDFESSSGRREFSSPLPGSVDHHATNGPNRQEQSSRPQSASFVHTSPSRESSSPLPDSVYRQYSGEAQRARPQTALPGTRTRLYSANRGNRPRRDLTWNDFTDVDEISARKNVGDTALTNSATKSQRHEWDDVSVVDEVPTRKSAGDTARTNSATESERQKEAVIDVNDRGATLAKVLENVTPQVTPPTSERRNRDDLGRFKGAFHVRKVQKFKRNAPITVLHTRARKSAEGAGRDSTSPTTRLFVDAAGERSPENFRAASASPGPASPGSPAFESQASPGVQEPHAIFRLTVTEATNLAGTVFGQRDPFCAVEIEGVLERTRVIPSTRHPCWNEVFVFKMKSLLSPVSVTVIDRHAQLEVRNMGTVEFRPIDIMTRAGWPRDTDTFSASAWFVLQNWAGMPVAGNIYLSFDVEGCQNAYVPEFKQKEMVVSLEELASEHVSETAPDDFGSRREKKDKGHESKKMDLIQLFEGQKQLEEGCEEGHYPFRSVNLFSNQNQFRRFVFKLVTSFSYQTVSWMAAVMACLSMGINALPVSSSSNLYATMEFSSYVFLAIEIILKCVAFGFAEKANSFLRGSAFNVVDFLCSLSYWIEFCLPSPHNAEFTLRPFRFFRILLPLTHFEVFTGLTAIFLTLKSAFLSLAVVMYFCFLFFVGFGIFAVTFYHDSFSRRCVNAETREISIPEQWCKRHESDESLGCVGEGQICSSIGNPGRALMSIFLAVSLDGQQEIMNRSIQSEPDFRLFGVFFFLMVTFFCRLLLFNLCVAVVTTTFHKVRRKVAHALKAMSSSNQIHPEGSEAGSRVKAEKREAFQGSKLFVAGVAQLSFRDYILAIVSHPLFEIVAMAGVLVNVVSLAMQSSKIDDNERSVLEWLEVSTQIMFIVELTLRMMGSNSLPEFFSHGNDKFDFFVFLLTAMCLFAQAMGVTRAELGLMSSLSALRFVRVVCMIEDIEHLLALALASINNIMNLLFFTFAFISVSSVVAMFFFKARKDDGDMAFEDYDTYSKAMVTLFQVFSSDNWRFALFRSMQHGFDTQDAWRTAGPAMFHMVFFFVCQAILINLYIAVIIENFNLANLSTRQEEIQRESVKHYVKRGVMSVHSILKRVIALAFKTKPKTEAEDSNFKADRSLGLFTTLHPLRLWATNVAKSTWFALLIMATIVLSLLALAVEPPAREIETLIPYSVLDAVNWVATMVFFFEFIIQVIRMGFVVGKESYLRSAWNVCDFIVLMLSFMDLLGGNTKQARVLRLGRALRPLRLIKRNQGMRLMVDALISTWRPVTMIVLLAFTVATIFAILGRILPIVLRMRRFECLGTENVENVFGIESVHGGMPGWIKPRAWDVPAQNFDTFPRAMLQFLAMNTFKWVDVMRLATAITEEGKSPVEDYRWHYVAFFIIYILIGCLFVMNLFVAFIIDGFEQLRKQDFKHLEVLANYESFVSLVRKWSPHKNKPKPTSSARVWIRTKIVDTHWFSFASTTCVYLNVTFMALYSPTTSSEEYKRFYDIQNHIFLALLIVEVVFNVAAVGVSNYLHDGWNHIDVASIVASFLAFVFPRSTFVRGLRLVKVFRLIKNVRALKLIFITLARAIPQFFSILLLMLIIFTMFSILLVNTVGLVREGQLKLGSPAARWPSMKPNFISYPVSMYSLFLITQGEDWHLLMYDASVQPPYCTEQFEGKEYGDCGVDMAVAVAIFFAFKLVAEYVLLNLLIGMIIDTFVSAREVGAQFYFETGRADVTKMLIQSAMNAKSDEKKKKIHKGGIKRYMSKLSSSAVNISASDASDDEETPDLKRNRSSGIPGMDTSTSPLGGGVAGEQETRHGSPGAQLGKIRTLSQTKSCVECWNDVTGGGAGDFILIPDVQVLLRMLPQPLGFARNAFGEPEISRKERAVSKLIWAELNVIAVERRMAEPDSRIWRWCTAVLGFRPPTPETTNYVTFEETFITLLHWRCPQYVPQDIKDARSPMMDDVVTTAHALAIARHVRRWLDFTALRGGRSFGRPSVPGSNSLLHSLTTGREAQRAEDSATKHGFLSAMTHEIRELGNAVALSVPRQGSNQRLYKGLQKATETKMSTAVGGLDARFARRASNRPEEDEESSMSSRFRSLGAARLGSAHDSTRRASDVRRASDAGQTS